MTKGTSIRIGGVFAALVVAPALCFQAEGQFSYSTNDGTLTITGYDGPGGTVVIPDRINGLPVTAIGEAAFQNRTNVNNFVIAESVTTIGARAFSGCSWLFGVTIPRGVSIPEYAFYRCFQLVDVVIPEGATNIGAYAFFDCPSLREVGIPDSVREIGPSAFQGSWRLANVTIGNGVLTIGDHAFSGCPLTNVTIGGSVTNIGASAFGGHLISVTLPKSVTRLGAGAFGGWKLRTVYFSGDAPMAHHAFGEGVTVYYLPGTTGWGATLGGRPTVLWNPSARINGSGFGAGTNGFGFTIFGTSNVAVVVEACTNLDNPSWFRVAECTLLGGSSRFNDPGSTNSASRFYRFKSPERVPFDYAISNGTITITGHLGTGGRVDIPETINGLPVTAIGDKAFWSRRDLTEVIIPDTVTALGFLTFGSCSSLTNVIIGKSVTKIEPTTFYGCRELTSITIPAGVTNLSGGVFIECFNLGALMVDTNNPFYTSVDGVVFDKARATLVLYPMGRVGSYTVPAGVTEIGTAAFGYCSQLTSVAMSPGVRRIGDDAFESCYQLTNVTMVESVTEIGASAFYRCTSLSRIRIPNQVTIVADGAFAGCTSLGDAEIGNAVTRIGEQAFAACTFGRIIIPNGVRSIGPSAFVDCGSLTNATIGSNVASIGEKAFYNCVMLASINLPAALTNIGNEALGWCGNLRAITVDLDNALYSSADGVLFDKSGSKLLMFPRGKEGHYIVPGGVTTIAEWAFEHSRLTAVTIADSVIEIEEQAFSGSGIRNVTIPDSVRNIGIGAFAASAVTNVVVGGGVTNISYFAFGSCPLTKVTVGANVRSIGNSAFAYCWYLKAVYFKGDEPMVGEMVFDNTPATVYYLEGTTGWNQTFAGRPTAVWNP